MKIRVTKDVEIQLRKGVARVKRGHSIASSASFYKVNSNTLAKRCQQAGVIPPKTRKCVKGHRFEERAGETTERNRYKFRENQEDLLKKVFK
ncbi:hypothetical protein NVP1139A_32 [Vibrio phage 1.139.A._10N.261.48.C6]|nr:hypothetical protein NVP1139A_32 [Vibrio phage 1.139.A._10N.261.48.C6]AUR90267.1 hypothetical protein NVP1139B_32 [Vibrio phage 1.139.B._10N.261.48.C6]AUR95588.1 hypothetical protein NVP1209O_31 [Vibrio phage 1.209.O._10N.222.52.B2]